MYELPREFSPPSAEARLRDGALAATAANTDAVDDEALLSAVAQAASLVRAGRALHAVDRRELAVLPHANAEKEAKHIRLLLLPELLDVLVRLRYTIRAFSTKLAASCAINLH